MGKTNVQRTPEENRERHEFKKRKKEQEIEWNKRLFEEQLSYEVRSIGLRDPHEEQGESVHKGE